MTTLVVVILLAGVAVSTWRISASINALLAKRSDIDMLHPAFSAFELADALSVIRRTVHESQAKHPTTSHVDALMLTMSESVAGDDSVASAHAKARARLDAMIQWNARVTAGEATRTDARHWYATAEHDDALSGRY